MSSVEIVLIVIIIIAAGVVLKPILKPFYDPIGAAGDTVDDVGDFFVEVFDPKAAKAKKDAKTAALKKKMMIGGGIVIGVLLLMMMSGDNGDNGE